MTVKLRNFAPAIAALLLLAGCIQTPEEGVVTVQVGANFTAQVTGKARVQWSDGDTTHLETIDSSGNHVFASTVDQDRSVAAITVVPVGAGSQVSCTIDIDGLPHDNTIGDSQKSSSADKAAVCYATGETDLAQPANARTIRLAATSASGGGLYRGITPDGAARIDNMAPGVEVDGTFTVIGPVHMIVVATKVDDTVTCRILDVDDEGTELDSDTGLGLGAIATCTAFVMT